VRVRLLYSTKRRVKEKDFRHIQESRVSCTLPDAFISSVMAIQLGHNSFTIAYASSGSAVHRDEN